ncbi:MAG: hypothetical protein A2W90_11425 [Bacteroidetes bacterium GWF2_42_66]|nr:MAG: hypothetical protein A2W89_23145 [Bacteroidetes bacterium GWE2_42_39]OFY44892.1 MAG: hypothetical protein A2W90_11425 [Bacteroidetes bacterium GWF2_42_66]HBL76019.1 hypothetical protein [Prolixibacteraceae bacterium]HCR89645.1 hypothetical protein [Prolixibacteraceae bacterium]HCU62135.1 hypothetical protein [Prolixibacteraceae bacterium]
MENRINITLTEETKGQAFQGINTLKTTMPFLLKLSNAERSSLQVMNDGRKPFVEKSFDYASRNASLNPGSGLLEAAPNDLELYSFLSSVENDLEQLIEMVRDTKQLAGSEAYEVARFIYMKAKMNVKLGMPGSQAIVDDLGKLFKQAGQATAQPAQ